MDPDFTDLEGHGIDELVALNQQLGREQDAIRARRQRIIARLKILLTERARAKPASGDGAAQAALPTVTLNPEE